MLGRAQRCVLVATKQMFGIRLDGGCTTAHPTPTLSGLPVESMEDDLSSFELSVRFVMRCLRDRSTTRAGAASPSRVSSNPNPKI